MRDSQNRQAQAEEAQVGIDRIRVRNYRGLADIDLGVGPINVLFGPNGAGKSTLLDTIYFFRDCAIRGVEVASADRDHGIGLLFDGASDDATIAVELTAEGVGYELSFALAAGRIDPHPGERLTASGETLIARRSGSTAAHLYNAAVPGAILVPLREPEKISLGLLLDFNRGDVAAAGLDRLLRFVRHYNSRSFHLGPLKRVGSQSSHQIRLWDFGNNAWSVLRNIQDRRNLDERYRTIISYMADVFPQLEDIVLEQTGPGSVYASFQERGRSQPISASGASDGVIQLLLLLIALFSEWDREAVLLFDEPEASLHPWALAVFARAVKEAMGEWHKQVFIATHSPVLISQFAPQDILAACVENGSTRFDRLSEMEDVRDLLEEYNPGSLYMAEAVARQSAEPASTDGG